MKLIDEKTTYISPEAKIADSAVIYPNNTILGDTEIGENTVIMPNCIIDGCKIGADVRITASVMEGAVIADKTTVGPFAYLRKGAYIGEGCRVGDFVEVKNAKIGDGTKVAHLTYVGDCELGHKCNVGCGVVFVNYDGKKKHHTKVGDGCFIGSNSNVIAPVEIADGSYIAAGTTITESTPRDSLVIGRARQVVKEGAGKGRF